MKQYLDFASKVIIVITFVLFMVALFLKGFTHDLLLEAGVFLVSVKLMMMAYKNSLASKELTTQLKQLQTTMVRIESSLNNDKLES